MRLAAPPENDSHTTSKQAMRGPEIGSALKRDRLLQRVRAARKRLTPAPGAVARLR